MLKHNTSCLCLGVGMEHHLRTVGFPVGREATLILREVSVSRFVLLEPTHLCFDCRSVAGVQLWR
jgi:hypothetical protein